MRLFMRLAYNGANFHGWQSQPNARSVQQTVEEALSTVLREPVAITGAGRTDTGVHASCMYAHFDAEIAPEDRPRVIGSLNRLCGRDIAVYEIIDVPEGAHARFDATSRTYKYHVSFRKTPFMQGLCWEAPHVLDLGAMNEAAAILTRTEDFTSFAKLHSDAKTNICRVSRAEWEWTSADQSTCVFTITADRFLRNMVRAVVGTLVDVGRGKLNIEGFETIINKRDRCAAGTSMPAHALYLHDITYPYIRRVQGP